MAEFFTTPDTGLPTPISGHDMDSQDHSTSPTYNQQPLKRKRALRDDYAIVLSNQQTALKSHLDKYIKAANFKHGADEDLEDLLLLEHNRKLDDRERKGSLTVRKRWPQMYSEQDDRQWLRKTFPMTLNRTGYALRLEAQNDRFARGGVDQRWGRGEDVDDDEPGLGRGGRKRAIPVNYDEEDDVIAQPGRATKRSRHGKSTFMEDVIRSPSIYSQNGNVMDSEARLVRDTKPTVGIACTRSFTILPGSTRAFASRISGDVKLTAATRGCMAEPQVQGRKRHWRWVDGKMVVWPAFEQS